MGLILGPVSCSTESTSQSAATMYASKFLQDQDLQV